MLATGSALIATSEPISEVLRQSLIVDLRGAQTRHFAIDFNAAAAASTTGVFVNIRVTGPCEEGMTIELVPDDPTLRTNETLVMAGGQNDAGLCVSNDGRDVGREEDAGAPSSLVIPVDLGGIDPGLCPNNLACRRGFQVVTTPEHNLTYIYEIIVSAFPGGTGLFAEGAAISLSELAQ